MTDGSSAMTSQLTFSQLVKEAFIDPIRSVLIIDDQYPTWEHIFGTPGYQPGPGTQWAPKEQTLRVISQFRNLSPAMTVDIHDGQDNSGIGNYLHQSDLLVLDYQLEKDSQHGQKAVEIIESLFKNNHFNLIIVHTAIDDLVEPFNKILMSLLEPVDIDEGRIQAGRKLIEEAEDGDYTTINSEIEESIGLSTYLAYRAHLTDDGDFLSFIENSAEASKYKNIVSKTKWSSVSQEDVFLFAISRHNRSVGAPAIFMRELRWCAPGKKNYTWIRTNGGFIAFAHKNTANLLTILQSAIEEWRPSPSRLMSAKIRSEISRQGAGAEDTALHDKHAYWHYYQILRGDPSRNNPHEIRSNRQAMLEAHAALHIERLLDLIGTKAIDYGIRILEADPTESDPANKGFSQHYSVTADTVGEKRKARDHYNALVSAKPVSGWHLQPGHIFKAEGEIWICLSPSCDLVPMQKATLAMLGSKDAGVKPFVAIQLTEVPNCKDEAISAGAIVFLKEGSTVKTFNIYASGKASGSPRWRLFLADRHGKIEVSEDRAANLKLRYLMGDNGAVTIKEADAKIIGQLRYEYALNLIQKLGVEFTRVGLEFATL